MTIRVLEVKPGCEPQVTEIEDSGSGVRSIIGDKGTIGKRLIGYFETETPTLVGLVYVSGREAWDLPPNRWVGAPGNESFALICGTFLLCGVQENGDFASLTDEQIRYYKEELTPSGNKSMTPFKCDEANQDSSLEISPTNDKQRIIYFTHVTEKGEVNPLWEIYKDITLLQYDGNIWTLEQSFTHMTEEEIRDMERGEIKMSIVDINEVLFLVYKFGNQPWCDASYEPRLTPVPLVYPEVKDPNSTIGLQINAYESTTGECKVSRFVELDHTLCNHLHSRCRERDKLRPMDRYSYNWKLQRIYNKYSTTSKMLKEVNAVYSYPAVTSA